MFLKNLNEEQQVSFLAIAMKIIGADGRLDPAERRMIEAMRVEMGLFHEAKLPTGVIEELAKPFDTHRAQVTVLLEGILLAYADNDFSGAEQKILRALAIIWGISEEEATELENWVQEYNKILKKAEQFFSK